MSATRPGRRPVAMPGALGQAPRWWTAAASTGVLMAGAGPAHAADGLLHDLVPAPLFELRVLDVTLWNWILLLVLVLVASTAGWLGALLVVRALRPVVSRSRTTIDEKILTIMAGPLRLAVALLVFAAGTMTLALSPPARALFGGIEKAAALLAIAWLLIRIVDVSADVAREHLVSRGRLAATGIVPAGRKATKAVVVVLAVLGMLQNVGIDVTGILAGLGIGGLAIALAAQKTIENLFGGVSVILDQPVRVGDFCRFGDRVGTIAEVGLRSTRVRTLDRTVVSIPNAQFAQLHLENFTLRDRIWLHPVLNLRYETTPDQLRYVLVEVRKMLYAHPRIDPDPARIRFVGFGACSLDLEIFAYVRTTDYGDFLAVREDVLLRIMDIVAASGSGFAFPSQTLYLTRDGGLDSARREAAERRVREWRQRGELYLPEFPPETIAELGDTLPYPADGTAERPRA